MGKEEQEGRQRVLTDWWCHQKLFAIHLYSPVLFCVFFRDFPYPALQLQYFQADDDFSSSNHHPVVGPWCSIFHSLRLSMVETHCPPILPSKVGIKVTLGWVFLPCGPHLLCKEYSGSCALTNLRNAGQSKLSPSSAHLPCSLTFPCEDIFCHPSTMLFSMVRRRSKLLNGPTGNLSLSLRFKKMMKKKKEKKNDEALYPILQLSLSSLWNLEQYNQFSCYLLFHFSYVLASYFVVCIYLQLKKNPVMCMSIQSLFVNQLMISSFPRTG